MEKTIPSVDEQAEFSLVQGGLLFHFLSRIGLLRPPADLFTRRVVVILLVIWLPLLVLSVAGGRAFGGAAVPFIMDIGAQARLLLSVSIVVAADVMFQSRMKTIVGQFREREIITPEDLPRFQHFITSATQSSNSVRVDLLIVAVAIIGGYWAGKRYVDLTVPTWFADDNGTWTAAGYWYLCVSLTIFRYLILRWVFRLVIWYRFLAQVARHTRLRLNALHPDQAGGLSFLAGSVSAFVPLLISQTTVLAGVLGNKIWHEGATLPQFKLEIAFWILLLLALVLTPLCFFMTQLMAAKRAGLREYGIVASRYVADFRSKWITGNAGKDEVLIGSADIQSLADLSNSFNVVREMRIVPFGRALVLRAVIVLAIPLLPLTLTMIPLEELMDRAIRVIF